MVEQNAAASQNMALEAERLRNLFFSRQIRQAEGSARIAAGHLVASSLQGQAGSGQEVPRIELPERKKNLDNFRGS